MISVIIPVYNMEKYLDDCVKSVLEQKYRDIEVLLVDDGSKDHSLEICEKWAKTDGRVKVFHKENGGQGSARNLALDNINGEYISFIDSDDLVMNDMYSYLMEVIQDTDSDVVICETKVFTDDNKPNLDEKGIENTRLTMNAFEAMEKRMTSQKYLTDSPCNKLYKAQLFKNLRFVEGRLLEDTAIMYRIVDLSKKITYIDKVGYLIRENITSVSRVKYNIKRCDTMITYEEMVDFIKHNDNYKSLIQNAQHLANGSVFYNAGEFYLAKIKDKNIKSKIKKHAKKQLKEYKNIRFKNKVLLYLISNMFWLYGIFYKLNRRR